MVCIVCCRVANQDTSFIVSCSQVLEKGSMSGNYMLTCLAHSQAAEEGGLGAGTLLGVTVPLLQQVILEGALLRLL